MKVSLSVIVRATLSCALLLFLAATIFAVPQQAKAGTLSGNDPLFCLAAGFGAGLCDSVVYTPFPNWALGSPQPAVVTACSFIVAGNCGGLEASESIAIWTARNVFGPATTNSLTFAQENGNTIANWAAGIVNPGTVGADIAIPNAYWITPRAYAWVGGPAGGGILELINTPGFANELIELDPPGFSPADLAAAFAIDLGGDGNLPTPVTLTPNSDGTIPIPPQDMPTLLQAPEPSALLLLGPALAGLLWRKRRSGRQGLRP